MKFAHLNPLRELLKRLHNDKTLPANGSCGCYLPSLPRRHATNSGATSEMFIPSETRNLQLRIGRAWSSSASWQLTRQYWHSWFQQKRPYGIVSGLMN